MRALLVLLISVLTAPAWGGVTYIGGAVKSGEVAVYPGYSAAQINAATASLTKGGVYFACGTYDLEDTILLRDGVEYFSYGGCATLRTPTSGTGFAVLQNPARTCTGGSGSCDSAIGGSGRGSSCACYSNSDCQSGTCTTTGAVARNVKVKGLNIKLRVDNSIAVDFANISEGTVEANVIESDVSTPPSNTIGVYLSDGNGTTSGYRNTIRENKIFSNSASRLMNFGIIVAGQANSNSIRDNRIQPNNGTCIKVGPEITTSQPPLATLIEGNNCEQFAVEGMHDQGKGTVFLGNYIEWLSSSLSLCGIQVGAKSTSVQVQYNFYTPSNVVNPVCFTAGNVSPVQINWASNLTDTSKFTNQWGTFKFQDYFWLARATAVGSCSASTHGKVYYDSDMKSLCQCDNYGGVERYCPVSCDASGANCAGGTSCTGSSSNCG